MKVTKKYLQKVIEEETKAFLSESPLDVNISRKEALMRMARENGSEFTEKGVQRVIDSLLKIESDRDMFKKESERLSRRLGMAQALEDIESEADKQPEWLKKKNDEFTLPDAWRKKNDEFKRRYRD